MLTLQYLIFKKLCTLNKRKCYKTLLFGMKFDKGIKIYSVGNKDCGRCKN